MSFSCIYHKIQEGDAAPFISIIYEVGKLLGIGEDKLHASRMNKKAWESKRVAQNEHSLSSGAAKKLAVQGGQH